MAKKVRQEINLLPKEEFESSTLGRVMKWLLTTFRYIVIVVEMVVMGAFLSRFWLDARSGDLIDAITQKRAIIGSYTTFEKQFRQDQNKLSVFSSFASNNSKITPVLKEISSKIPANIVITSLSVSGTKIVITANSGDEQSIAAFVDALSKSSFFASAKLTSFQSKANSAITFSVAGDLKRGGANGS